MLLQLAKKKINKNVMMTTNIQYLQLQFLSIFQTFHGHLFHFQPPVNKVFLKNKKKKIESLYFLLTAC